MKKVKTQFILTDSSKFLTKILRKSWAGIRTHVPLISVFWRDLKAVIFYSVKCPMILSQTLLELYIAL